MVHKMSNSLQSIDSHHHLWIICQREYSWLKSEFGVIYGDLGPELIAPVLTRAGVTGTFRANLPILTLILFIHLMLQLNIDL